MSGYGVEMAIKNMEYKAVDDRQVPSALTLTLQLALYYITNFIDNPDLLLNLTLTLTLTTLPLTDRFHQPLVRKSQSKP